MTTDNQQPTAGRASQSVYVIVSLLLIFLAISRQSIWIDEGATAAYAMTDNVGEFLRLLTSEGRSEAQMPLGMFLPFVFEKLVGHSEYALRLPNLLWLGLGVIALAALGRRVGAPWLPLLLAIHPMVWHYADEARPYAFQIGMASVLLWSTACMLVDDRLSTRVLWIWWLAAFALCASNLMAAIVFAVWFIVFLGFARRRIFAMTAGQWALSGVMLLLMGLLACYYVWTVWRGAGGAILWKVGLSNVAFVLFEFGGFMGLSPGRIALREAGQQGAGAVLVALKPYALPMAALALVYISLIGKGLWHVRLWRGNTILLFSLSAFCIGVALVYVLCMVMGFPFWGRHLAPLLPVALFALAICNVPGRFRTRLMIVLMALLLISSLIQRLHPQHKKDDYRAAAMLALEAEGEGRSVLWAANLESADYYGYQPRVHYLNFKDDAEHLHVDVVFYSKPDIFDPHDEIAALLEEGRYGIVARVPAITVWHRRARDASLP